MCCLQAIYFLREPKIITKARQKSEIRLTPPGLRITSGNGANREAYLERALALQPVRPAQPIQPSPEDSLSHLVSRPPRTVRILRQSRPHSNPRAGFWCPVHGQRSVLAARHLPSVARNIKFEQPTSTKRRPNSDFVCTCAQDPYHLRSFTTLERWWEAIEPQIPDTFIEGAA
jgi:hypothetical protein